MAPAMMSPLVTMRVKSKQIQRRDNNNLPQTWKRVKANWNGGLAVSKWCTIVSASDYQSSRSTHTYSSSVIHLVCIQIKFGIHYCQPEIGTTTIPRQHARRLSKPDRRQSNRSSAPVQVVPCTLQVKDQQWGLQE